MKTIKKVQNSMLTFLITLFSLTGCVQDDDYTPPAIYFPDLTANYTISELKSAATSRSVLFTDDAVLEGYVVSSDEGGNIFNTLHIVTEDGKSGFQVNISRSGLYNLYPVGRKVFVNLKGLYYARQHNMVQLGGESNTYSTVGAAEWSMVKDKVLLAKSGIPEENLVQKYSSIPEVLKNENLNTLVEIEGVQFQDAYLGKTYFDEGNVSGSATDNYIEDRTGSRLIVRVSQYAKFARHEIASGSGKIRGILTKYGTNWQFMVRTIGDIDMQGERFNPSIKGSLNSPYSVSEGILMQNQFKIGWVKGFIVGTIVNDSKVTFIKSEADVIWGAGGRPTSVLIAETSTIRDYSKCIVVNLPIGTVREAINLADNPENLGKELLIKGELKNYFGIAGVRDITDYTFVNE